MVEDAEDRDYFERRAEAEIEAAQAANHAAVVRAHYQMASHYLDLVHNPEPQAGSKADETDRAGAGWMPGLRIIAASPRA